MVLLISNYQWSIKNNLIHKTDYTYGFLGTNGICKSRNILIISFRFNLAIKKNSICAMKMQIKIYS